MTEVPGTSAHMHTVEALMVPPGDAGCIKAVLSHAWLCVSWPAMTQGKATSSEASQDHLPAFSMLADTMQAWRNACGLQVLELLVQRVISAGVCCRRTPSTPHSTGDRSQGCTAAADCKLRTDQGSSSGSALWEAGDRDQPGKSACRLDSMAERNLGEGVW